MIKFQSLIATIFRLTQQAKECEQSKSHENVLSRSLQQSNDIISLLHNAHDKFQESVNTIEF